MMQALLGLPAKINTLLNRLTDARAALLGNLSYLDATVSSRAPASTALSTATWTTTRAAKLDSIMTSVLAPSGVQHLSAAANFGSGPNVNIVIPIPVAVNTAKSIIIDLGYNAGSYHGTDYSLVFINSTSVRLIAYTDATGVGTFTFYFSVVEFA
jgi:ribonuclease PH